ncbi:MAG: KpsF/GutQ family sugar-phosphate isomerase [Robiginitomaculum sp.]|nr:MAG: KpsF/GutQ family sugar-phosphate isomerase [Robiginitomaculum sp.]
MKTFDAIDVARRVLKTETDGLMALSDGLDEAFPKVVDLLKALEGRTILAGVGKSGHVARKIAATFASTGTTSLFVHPTEASHGDMGMMRKEDAVIALSRSGETKELADMIGFCKRFGLPLIAMTCRPNSTLARAADHVLLLPDAPEACNVTGAPTTSTTLQIALGDALAVALLEARGFTAGDFKTFHPGGALGAQLASAADLMHTGALMPIVDISEIMERALLVMGEKGFGCVGIVDANEALVGIITDGDIRRNLDKDLPKLSVKTIMTKNPKSIAPDILAAEALHIMTAETPKVMQVFVVKDEKPVGILHMHDLLRAGLA